MSKFGVKVFLDISTEDNILCFACAEIVTFK